MDGLMRNNSNSSVGVMQHSEQNAEDRVPASPYRHEPSCPGCRNLSTIKAVGQIPDCQIFAGALQPAPIPGGVLHHCGQCGINFRSPRLSDEELRRLYVAASASGWRSHAQDRPDWQFVYDRIRTLDVGRILDIGCYDGKFLEGCPEGWTKIGIEPNAEASRVAENYKVKIIGTDFSVLSSQKAKFDVITMFDVIEHVPNPLAILSLCSESLSRGGRIFVSTGNTSSMPWRLLGSRNSYCIPPEHIAFINPDWCMNQAPNLGLGIAKIHVYRRGQFGIGRIAFDLFKISAYLVAPSLFSWLRKRGVGQATSHAHGNPPLWPSAKDHFIVEFVKI